MESKANLYRIPPGADPPAYPGAHPSTYPGVYPPPPPPPPPLSFVPAPNAVRGPLPVQCVCHNCHQHVVTRIERSSGLVTWAACLGISCLGCVFGCCLIPFCIDDLKKTTHYCPNCSIVLGHHDLLD